MTVVGDEVIKLLELGDVFRWVTDGERAKALELLERDTRFDATITQFQTRKVLRDFFTRYFNQQSAPSLYDAVMLMAAKAGPVSVSSIENNLAGFFFFDRDAAILNAQFGNPAKVFGLANDLADSMRKYGLLSISTKKPITSATIPSSPSASFSGSGATGRDIFNHRVSAFDQARILYEQKTNPQGDPGASGPVSRSYSNPLWNGLTVPSSASERLRQAARITSLPISTLFEPIYLNGRPSRGAVMNAAAKTYNLTPEVIGAIVLAEQRDQSQNEDMLDYTAATHSVSRRTTSVGLGQVRDDTVARTDLFSGLLEHKRRQGLDGAQIATLLTCDEFNIFAVAKYIRYVANLVGKKTKTDLPRTAAAFPGINFAAYAQHARNWPADNVAALGSEYTSRPWDDRVTGWGSFVGEAHSDMSGAKISW